MQNIADTHKPGGLGLQEKKRKFGPYSDLFQNLNAQQFQVGPINGIIGFDGDLATLEGSYRIALWYEWNIEKPEQIGVILDGQT